MSNMVIGMEAMCIIVCLVLLAGLLAGDNIREKLPGILFWTLLVNIVALAGDLLSYIFDGKSGLAAFILNQIGTFLAFLCAYLIIIGYYRYVYTYFREKLNLVRAPGIVIGILSGISIGMLVLNQFWGFLYSFDAQNHYIRGKYGNVNVVINIIIVTIGVVLLCYYRKKMKYQDFFSFLSYLMLPGLALIILYLTDSSKSITLAYIATTISMMILYVNVHVQRSRQMKEQELELTQSNIVIMLSQIRPHFLFNVLTAISQLCSVDPKEARKATIEFAMFLRGGMDSLNAKQTVPFDQELNYVRLYLSIEKRGFGENLNIEWDIRVRNFMIPVLVLQPIVENAVCKGVKMKEDGGTVWISSEERKKEYCIEVIDDGVGFNVTEKKEDGKSHVGISNVRSRLEIMCGGTLEIESKPGEGTRVSIHIPKFHPSA